MYLTASAIDKTETVVSLLSRALQRIRTTPPRIIASPATRESCTLSDLTSLLTRFSEPRRCLELLHV